MILKFSVVLIGAERSTWALDLYVKPNKNTKKMVEMLWKRNRNLLGFPNEYGRCIAIMLRLVFLVKGVFSETTENW